MTPGDEDAFIDAIREARRLDRAAIRAQALQRFSLSACVDRYETLLRDLAMSAQ